MDLVLQSDVDQLTDEERGLLAALPVCVIHEPGEFLTLDQVRAQLREVAVNQSQEVQQ